MSKRPGLTRGHDEDEFRLRPRHRPVRREPTTGFSTFNRLVRAVTASAYRRRRMARTQVRTPFRQRCSVRLTYTQNRVKGHFAAHARYLLRDKAMGDGAPYGTVGQTPLVDALASWQEAGDSRLFKLILSPEFGNRLDLTRLTTDFMARLEADFAQPLEWAAVNHYDTDHPHVHLVIRGATAAGHDVHFPRPYVQESLRTHAEALCTEQLGFRSQADLQHARENEVRSYRVTSLDRAVLAKISNDSLDLNGGHHEHSVIEIDAKAEPLLAARLRFLTASGLVSEEPRNGIWRVPHSLPSMLRLMQQATDRQRMLAHAGVPVSDDRLPVRVTDVAAITQLRGRVLAHALDESPSGRVFMILEGTDGAIHFVPHSPALERQRSRGRLALNHVVMLERSTKGLRIQDLGNADAYLQQRTPVHALPNEVDEAAAHNWRGWLGQFHAQVRANNVPVIPHAPPERER